MIDILDECDERTKGELLGALTGIMRQSKELVSIMVSSRDDVDIVQRLEKFSEYICRG